MDFKQQYKTEMQNISPSEEQCERIRAKVYEAIQNPPNSQIVQNAPKRKPLPLKAIAITGASAACLVLVSALALQILPKKENLASGGADFSGICAMEANKADTADEMNAGHGIEPEVYNSASLSPTADGSAGLNSKGAFEYQEPSISEKSGDAESLAAGSLVVKMVFSKDGSECEVFEGRESQKYALSNEAPLTADKEELLEEFPAIQSNIEKPLFIYTSGDKMWVYDENKQFIGCFIKI